MTRRPMSNDFFSGSRERQFRRIDTGANDTEEPKQFHKSDTVHIVGSLDSGTKTIERIRDGDFITVRVEEDVTKWGTFGSYQVRSKTEYVVPATIEFEQIVEQAEVEEDPDTEMPWDDQDGWEHDLQEFDAFYERFSSSTEYKDVLRQFIAAHGTYYANGMWQRVLITDESYCGDSRESRIKYLRSKGASKQVAREVVAYDDRRYIANIKEWRKNGYHTVMVTCDVCIGDVSYGDVISGYEADYSEEAKREVAEMVASSLEKDGFTVVYPEEATRETTYKAAQRESKIFAMRHRLHMFDVGREKDG